MTEKPWVDVYKKDRRLYLAEAASEYMITIMLAGAYIAKLGTALGMDTATVGVLTSFIGVGATAFQLLSLLLPGSGPIKRTVLFYQTLSQIAFAVVWLLPVFPIAREWKAPLFIALLAAGLIVLNGIVPAKTAWYMGMVDDRKRGVFIALKDSISMACYMIYGFLLGAIIDAYEAADNLNGAFFIGGLAIVGFSAVHFFSLLFTRDRETAPAEQTEGRLAAFRDVLSNRAFWRVLLLSILVKLFLAISMPFYGTYITVDLRFSMVFISAIEIVYGIVRIAGSFVLGRFADRFSFSKMFFLAFPFGILSVAAMIFANRETGRFMYILYEGVLSPFFYAGLWSALTNMTYDAVSHKQRTAALALYQSISGAAGFLVTLGVGFLVSYMENGGVHLFDDNLSIQQELSIVAVAVGLAVWGISALLVPKQSRQKNAPSPAPCADFSEKTA